MGKSAFSRQYSAFLHRLRECRHEAGMTQEELAARLHTTQSFVSKCERGERRIDIAVSGKTGTWVLMNEGVK